jgi:hypothetical protein
MALLKEYSNNQGVVVTYWSISGIKRSMRYKTAEVTISGYLSQSAKQNGCEAVEVRRIKVLLDKYDTYFSVNVLNQSTNDIQQGYVYIKANEIMFTGATDV